MAPAPKTVIFTLDPSVLAFIGLGLGPDLLGVERADLGDEIVGDDVRRLDRLLDHRRLQQEVEIGLVVGVRALAPAGRADLFQAPVLGARLQRLDVVLERGRLVLADGLGLDAAQRHARILDQRVLRVVEAQRVDLLRAHQRRRLRPFADDDDAEAGVRVEPEAGGDGARHGHAAGRHRLHADALALEVLERLDRAVRRHGRAVDVALVGGVVDLGQHALRPERGQRLDRGQRIEHLARADIFDAVGRARQRHQLDIEPRRLEPAHLVGDGEGSRRRGHRARAPADAQRLGVRRTRAGKRCQRDDPEPERLPHTISLLRISSGAAFIDGSQNRTRRRSARIPWLSSSPNIDRMNRIENTPATSALKLRLSISIPSPCVAPTNSATMAPISAKIIATSRPAMMKGSAPGRRSIQKICALLASSERIRLTRSSSAERRPTMVLTMSGKKAMSAAFTTFEVSPSPNQMTMSGASATFGSDWNMMMKG